MLSQMLQVAPCLMWQQQPLHPRNQTTEAACGDRSISCVHQATQGRAAQPWSHGATHPAARGTTERLSEHAGV
jgi:hypothetical protein